MSKGADDERIKRKAGGVLGGVGGVKSQIIFHFQHNDSRLDSHAIT